MSKLSAADGRLMLELITAARLAKDSQSFALDSQLETECLLDANLKPRRDTLPATMIESVARQERQIEELKSLIGRAEQRLRDGLADLVLQPTGTSDQPVEDRS